MGYPTIFATGTLRYDNKKAWSGYTLFPSNRGALLIDMNGNEVQRWAGLGGFPNEESIEPISVEDFRVPGSPVGKDNGKTTVVEGIDPNKLVTLGGKDKKKGEDEEINFCVASVKKSDLEKIS